MSIEIRACDKNKFEQIKNYIQQFQLDDREIIQSQFLAAYAHNILFGFGRIREHSNCSELCSLGVLNLNDLKA